jgi:CelD/BcsL family acetyltransferase involved in cellulose biosynthesis
MGLVNPLERPGWDDLVATHPGGSFFHTTAWARVLAASYGHAPFYFCRFDGNRLAELLPVMEVSSPFTGRRGVSLPFTDFCPPLADGDRSPAELYERAMALGRERRWRYLETRGDVEPADLPSSVVRPPSSLAFHGHVIELDRNPDALFKRLDGATRRGIRKAQDARLQIEFGSSAESLREFCRLHCRTRRRHGLPPQPRRFFDNIGRFVLAQRHGFVVTARLESRSVAAAVFFHHGRRALFKFGASDYRFQQMRPNNLVMWEALKRLADEGFASLHLGRTSLATEGLFVTDTDRAAGWHNGVFRCLPPPLLRLAGRMLYPHLS